MCRDLDTRVGHELNRIQVDPDQIPLIRAAYTKDLNSKITGRQVDERTRLDSLLKSIDEEEARAATLFAAGKFTEGIWDNLSAKWLDRRTQIRRMLQTLTDNHQAHIDNLDTALQIIAQLGTLYNGLERKNQKELLRQVISRVVVNETGNVSLELRTPFAYLHDHE